MEKVYAVSSSSSKRSLALALGAYEYIDSSSVNVVNYIKALGGAKLIICTAPYSNAINNIIPAVAKNGKFGFLDSCIKSLIRNIKEP